jgi:hypothetical protein
MGFAGIVFSEVCDNFQSFFHYLGGIMQDLSKPTGSQISVRIGGREVLLSGFSFEDIGLLQNEIRREKRRAKLETAKLAGEYMPPEHADEQMQRAITACESISVSEADIEGCLQTTAGIVTFFWVLLERQYPRQFNRGDVLQALASQAVSKEQIGELLDAFMVLQGKSESQTAMV